MAASTSAPVPIVHLIGSLPLQTTAEVFSTLSSSLPNRLRRIPDGETGERGLFTLWQATRFPKETIHLRFFEEGTESTDDFELTLDHIGPTGYDDAALASYDTFLDMRAKGVIEPGVRFQVSLPTPLNSVDPAVRVDYSLKAHDLYETRLLESLANIQAHIPPKDLAIQWDMAIEMAHMEYTNGTDIAKLNHLRPAYAPIKETIVSRVVRVASAVGPKVEMGFHFCYGDLGHKHFMEPVDTKLLVDLINDVHAAVSKLHSVDWIQLPVPKGRVDSAYFEPLSRLNIGDTLPILGLVHANDAEGTAKRISVAKHTVPLLRFAVSTECGLGRTPREELNSILEISKDVTVSAAL